MPVVVTKALCFINALQVHLRPADTITFIPHVQHDLLQYSSLSQLAQQVSQQGYYGSIRLLMVPYSCLNTTDPAIALFQAIHVNTLHMLHRPCVNALQSTARSRPSCCLMSALPCDTRQSFHARLASPAPRPLPVQRLTASCSTMVSHTGTDTTACNLNHGLCKFEHKLLQAMQWYHARHAL